MTTENTERTESTDRELGLIKRLEYASTFVMALLGYVYFGALILALAWNRELAYLLLVIVVYGILIGLTSLMFKRDKRHAGESDAIPS